MRRTEPAAISSAEFFDRARARLRFDVPVGLTDASVVPPSGDQGTDRMLKIIAQERPIRPAAVLIPVVDRAQPTVLLTQRAATLKDHAGQVSFPGGRIDPQDETPWRAALREAHEETGIDLSRVHPLATLARTFIAPSQFEVVPILAYSPDPGPVAVVNETETAIVSRVPVRAFINPANRLMVYRGGLGHRWAGPAFLLNQMLVWGFTGQVISAVLDVAGWAKPWDTDDVRELDDAMMLVGDQGGSQ